LNGRTHSDEFYKRLFDRSEAFNGFFSGDMKKKGMVGDPDAYKSPAETFMKRDLTCFALPVLSGPNPHHRVPDDTGRGGQRRFCQALGGSGQGAQQAYHPTLDVLRLH
jgi:hypothetical protein